MVNVPTGVGCKPWLLQSRSPPLPPGCHSDSSTSRSEKPCRSARLRISTRCSLAGSMRCAFVCGLPSDVSSTLRDAARINTAELAAIAEHARVLMSERLHGGAMVAINKTRKILPVENRPRGKLQCYECGGDHPVKYCKVRKPLTCWTCGESDHISR